MKRFLFPVALLAVLAVLVAATWPAPPAAPAPVPGPDWVKKTVNGRTVATETVTLPNGATTAVNTNVIDFVDATKGFVVVANTGAVNTTADGDVDVQISFDNSTWVTAVADLISTFDTAVKYAKFDPANNSAHPQAPYYRLQITNDGNQGAESFGYAIIVAQ